MELRVTYFILSRCVSKPWRRDIREMKNPWGIGQRDEHTPSVRDLPFLRQLSLGARAATENKGIPRDDAY
jgi:hypothetical protein